MKHVNLVLALVFGVLLSASSVSRASSPPPRTCTAPCPTRSLCTLLSGSPTCPCPPPTPHYINGQCSNGRLVHWGYLDPQNAARAAVGSPLLVWNTTLASLASSWAKTLATMNNCLPRILHTPGIGQNVASSSQPPLLDNIGAMNVWVSQGGNYSRAKFSTVNSAGCLTGKWQDCAGYTQVVWKTTLQVGCSAAFCSAAKVWVCNYWPAGNINGQFPF